MNQDHILKELQASVCAHIEWRENNYFKNQPTGTPSTCREPVIFDESVQFGDLGIYNIDFREPTEKEAVQDEINELLYKSGTMLIFCDASFHHGTKLFVGARTIYLANNNCRNPYAKITSKFCHGLVKDNNHAEVEAAIFAMRNSESDVENWFRHKHSSLTNNYSSPKKIVMYCDNIIPVNIFRWAKHNKNYNRRDRSRSRNRSGSPESVSDSKKQLHELVRTAFVKFFEDPCNHMLKSRHNPSGNNADEFILDRQYRDQLRTDTDYKPNLDCFDLDSNGFDLRHCPGHQGIGLFDDNDRLANRELSRYRRSRE